MSERRSWRWRNIPVPEAQVAGLGLGLVVHAVWPRRFGGPAAVRSAGLVLLATGMAIVAWATASAGSSELEQPDRLIVHGPYAHSRNPMYVGCTLVYVGAAVLWDTAWPLIVLPGVAAAVHREVRQEEVVLARRFGAMFEAYAARVRRYL